MSVDKIQIINTLVKYSKFNELYKFKILLLQLCSLNDVYSIYNNQDICVRIINIINDSLALDFHNTVIEGFNLLRRYYNFYLSQILIVAIIINPKRASYNETHPGVLRKIINEFTTELSYICIQYKLLKKYGNIIPSIWKREIARILENIDDISINKYIIDIKNSNYDYNVNLIDIIRIVHVRGNDNSNIKKLLKNGLSNFKINKFQFNEKQSLYFENKIYFGKDILLNLDKIIKNIIDNNINDKFYINNNLDVIYSKLIINIKLGNYTLYSYYIALRCLQKKCKNLITDKNYIDIDSIIIKWLSDGIDILYNNMEKIKGRVDCLADNSDSCYLNYDTEYGSISVVELNNLAALVTTMVADNGYIWIFSDNIVNIPINRNLKILENLLEITRIGINMKGLTKNGLSQFWKNHYDSNFDNIFIYSDINTVHYTLEMDLSEKYISDNVKNKKSLIIIIKNACENKISFPLFCDNCLYITGPSGNESKIINDINNS